MTIKDTNLALYHSFFCPYCYRVTDTLQELGVEIALCNTFEGPHRQRLVEATGSTMVPALHIKSEDGTERWMRESMDIVKYLQHKFG